MKNILFDRTSMIIKFVGFYGFLWFQLVAGVSIRWITTMLDSSTPRACKVELSLGILSNYLYMVAIKLGSS